ncbi:hypothetical protein PybrP1_010329 [[Pythium] brassicae (nom. inval.)]|nr:hypothetical protein PybrP1_010329 [[Pythium] brassicae (nom. inval.)]
MARTVALGAVAAALLAIPSSAAFDPLAVLAELVPPDFSLAQLSEAIRRGDTDWRALGAALHDAGAATLECVRLWLVFVALAAGPLLRGAVVVAETLLPHVLALVRAGAEVVAELEPAYQAALALVAVATVVGVRRGYFRRARSRYLDFKRSAELRYRSFLASLSHTSRAAVVLLPHAAFFAAAYTLLAYAPASVVDVLDNEALFSFFATGYPLLRTVLIIRHRRLYTKRRSLPASQQQQQQQRVAAVATGTTTSVARRVSTANTSASARAPPPRVVRSRSIEELVWSEWRPYETILKYWVLWSLASCAGSVVSLFLPRFVLALVTAPTYAGSVFLAWVHSPVTRGDIALYTLLSPVLNPYANRLRDVGAGAARATGDTEATSFVMRALVALRVLPEQRVALLQDLWSQGPALAGLLFVFTPGFVTARGCMLVGFGFPAYVTMGALAEKTARRYEWWLSYFCVAVALDSVLTAAVSELAWLPLFYHAKLLLLMWLQFPYFRGAQKIFDTGFASVFVVPGGEEVEARDASE